MNVLIVEPSYRSKYPPLGLMRISACHKARGDCVTFIRGKMPEMRVPQRWHRIYVGSLFTYELPRTVDTVNYYADCVPSPGDLWVGGIGATLLPEYVKERVPDGVHVFEGPLDRSNMLGLGEPPVAECIPDYAMIDSVEYGYRPRDSYFIRVSIGCIRKCQFCAVRLLEPTFGYLQSVRDQLDAIDSQHGERQNLVIMDNNILALENLDLVIAEIRDEGFARGSKRGGKLRTVDCNQGIDARLINEHIAEQLYSIALKPVRLAFDNLSVEKDYRRAVALMANAGFKQFTTYTMFNYKDDPASFYRRLQIGHELGQEHGVKITSFPMRFIPIDDVNRHYISPNWSYRWLRGIQCILQATHGIVSPSVPFFERAFGATLDEFLEITAMPDDYIIYRAKNETEGAAEWRSLYRRLAPSERRAFLSCLQDLHASGGAKRATEYPEFLDLLVHYYPEIREGVTMPLRPV